MADASSGLEDVGNHPLGDGESEKEVEKEVKFGEELLPDFVKRFQRELPQELSDDIRNSRYDGSFFKASSILLRFAIRILVFNVNVTSEVHFGKFRCTVL